MSTHFAELKDCREFAMVLKTQPPRIVHGTLLLLSTLIFSAVAWSWMTRADLVVQAKGRVRPTTPPKQVMCTPRDSRIGGSLRVVAVHFRPGDPVREGDALLHLNTEQLENEMARRRRTIQSGEEELTSLALQQNLLNKQMQATRLRLEAELLQAEAAEKSAQGAREADTRLAQAEFEATDSDYVRKKKLAQTIAIVAEDVEKAKAAYTVALAKLEKARLPIDDSKIKIAKQSILILEEERAYKLEEVTARLKMKRGEVEAAKLELSNLDLEYKQAVLRSPMDGIVSAGEIRVGDVLDATKPVVEVSESKGFCFEAVVPSSEMAHIKVGMHARVRLDAYDYQRYGTLTGLVSFVAPDSTASEGKPFTYVVRVRLDGDELVRGELHAPIKLGLSGEVEIVSDQQRLLGILLMKIRQKISLD